MNGMTENNALDSIVTSVKSFFGLENAPMQQLEAVEDAASEHHYDSVGEYVPMGVGLISKSPNAIPPSPVTCSCMSSVWSTA